MDGEIEFLQNLGNQLRRVAAEQTSTAGSRRARWRHVPRIRVLPAMAVALVLAVAGLTLWVTVPAREGLRTQPAPGDGQQQPGPAAGILAPLPTGQELRAVDAASATDVWAVGSRYVDDTYRARSLILHWDGQAWTRVASPDIGMLTDVAAASEDAAWAIGGEDKILRWDGTAWEVSAHPAPPSAFFSSIDASGPDDAWAVGMQYGAEWVDQYGDRNVGYDTFTMHWDGATWTVVPSPNAAPRHNFVESVLALSSTDAWVAGYSQEGSHPRTLTMHWDGTAWSLVPSPDPGSDFNVLWGMGTDGSGGVWALGHYGYEEPDSHVMALYLRWDGSQWNVVPGPSGEALHQTPTAFSGAWADDAWAVGSEPTSSFLVAHWDGSSWSTVQAEIPNGGDPFGASLADVVSVSAADAWAVGRYQGPPDKDGVAETFPLIEHWNGIAWGVMEAPALDG
jgi:hypothetical protein